MSKKLLAAVLALSLVMSLLFVPAAAATTFDDVAEDHWAASSIEKWAGYGVLTGHGDGTFTPDVVMTRAEFATMLVKMLGLTAKSESSFTDTADHWAADFISIAVKAGIINGVGDNKFDPDEPIDFTQAAVMMCRAFGLAKNTSGTDWSKESIDKLTSLGMIGEGADEHLQVGVKCDRAVVAKLADTMVAEYVAEDRATPITGEVNGVILVVKGAKAEIKDATLAAPVVAESASVTLTNTKADAVIVSGKDAAVTADEASTVASVVLAGEAPKADIKGEVASVTVAEETKGAVIEAPKAADNAIVNNSGTDITVNGETVSNKADDTPNNPADTTATDTTKTDEHVHSFSYTAHAKDGDTVVWTHTKTCTGKAKCKFVDVVDEACTKIYTNITDTEHTVKCAATATVAGEGTNCSNTATEAHNFGTTGVCACGMKKVVTGGNGTHTESGQHNFVVLTGAEAAAQGGKAATCTEDGVEVSVCQDLAESEGVEAITGCGAVQKRTIKATGHNWPKDGEDLTWTEVSAATCLKKKVVKHECGTCHTIETQEVGELAAHTLSGAYTKNATQHSQVCTVCKKAIPVNHTWVNDENGGKKCNACGYVCQHSVKETIKGAAATCTAPGEKDGEKCSICGYVITAPATDATNKPALGHKGTNGNEAGKFTCTRCNTENLTCTKASEHASMAAGATCSECGYTKPAASTGGTGSTDPGSGTTGTGSGSGTTGTGSGSGTTGTGSGIGGSVTP